MNAHAGNYLPNSNLKVVSQPERGEELKSLLLNTE